LENFPYLKLGHGCFLPYPLQFIASCPVNCKDLRLLIALLNELTNKQIKKKFKYMKRTINNNTCTFFFATIDEVFYYVSFVLIDLI
jgi:hypothetical protein